MFADLITKHGSVVWLVNTGWVGGKYGTGSRISLQHTRAIIDAIHSGALSHPSSSLPSSSSSSTTAADESTSWTVYPTFNLHIPTSVPGVPSSILNPANAWIDEEAFERERFRLAGLFRRAFRMFENDVDGDVRAAGPDVLVSESPSVR